MPDPPLEADMDLAMGAFGLRAAVVEAGPHGGPEVSVTSDALAVRTSSDAASGGSPAAASVTSDAMAVRTSAEAASATSDAASTNPGSLAAAEATVTRLRLGLEGDVARPRERRRGKARADGGGRRAP